MLPKTIVNYLSLINNYLVKGSRLQILLIIGLLGLLGLLGFLQYSWQTQISVAEKERLEKRLKADSERFAKDFNDQISAVLTALNMEPNSWKNQDLDEFNRRFNTWFAETKYPKLVKNIYYLPKDETPLTYNINQQIFRQIEWTTELQEKFGDFENPKDSNSSVILPIIESPLPMPKPGITDNLRITVSNNNKEKKMPFEKIGSLIIEFDEAVIKQQVLADLVKSYFPDGDFEIQIINKKDEAKVFETKDFVSNQFDSSVPIFMTKSSAVSIFFSKSDTNTVNNRIVLGQKIETQKIKIPREQISKNGVFEVLENTQINSLTGNFSDADNKSRWLLNVQHTQGSLQNYVNKTRNQNLAIGFGILSLLGVCIGLIFVTTNRARRFAQRQVDFVSSVSHEFRTPLAVIYSAGENLSDGVIDSREKVTNYGNLIKGEGKKLSAMVEQILEFAGANSGKKKYKFADVNVSQIVENAIVECKSLFEKEDVVLIKDIAQNLPNIYADENALSHAIQNLITNSIKYSNGKKHLQISTQNINNQIKIEVTDKGIGIAKQDLRQIFEPFYRAKDVVDAQIHGNGLGLSLVKQIVSAHGGKITAESELGKGSKFTIIIPIKAK